MAGFPFQKLEAVQVAEQCVVAVAAVLPALPRGEARLRVWARPG